MINYVSANDGDWGTITNWTPNGTPGSGDTISINHNITMDGNRTIGTNASATTSAITINNGGVLRWPDAPGGDWTLTLLGRIDIAAGGTFQVGSLANPIPTARTATVFWGGSYEFINRNAGTFRVYGYANHHMASEASQRTRLIADAVSGAGVTIQVAADVDWSIGDVLWFGTGGCPDHTPTACEQATITGKTNASTYTITLANNHFGDATYGDIVVHATRNVILSGTGSTQGFSWHNNDSTTCVWDINWAKWIYHSTGGGTIAAAISFYHSSVQQMYPIGCLALKNCVFDTPGDAAGVVLDFYRFVFTSEDTTFSNVTNLHAWGHQYFIKWTTDGVGPYYFGNLTALNSTGGLISFATSDNRKIWISSLWYCSDGGGSGRYINYGTYFPPIRIDSFKIHQASTGYYHEHYAGNYYSGTECRLTNGEVWHVSTNGLYLEGDLSNSESILIDNVKFRDIESSAIYIIVKNCTALIKDCTFDDCGTTEVKGAVSIGDKSGTGFTYGSGKIKLMGCTFGSTVQNSTCNVYIGSVGCLWYTGTRIIMENCDFKIPNPTNPVGGYDALWWYPQSIYIAIGRYTVYGTTYENRAGSGASWSIEFLNCKTRNAAGTDLWPTDFPNTNIWGWVAQGTEIHKTHQTNEASGYIDGTIQRKIVGFGGTCRAMWNGVNPIRIPVSSGETISISVSLKKNISQSVYKRPMVHLMGSGIFDEAVMTDAINTWDVVTVGGTATSSGMVYLYFSGYGELWKGPGAPTKTPTADYYHKYPIPPDTGNNLVLYIDGLSVIRT